MKKKQCNKCITQTDESFAMQLLKEYSKTAKRWFIACMVILVMWISTIAGFLVFLNQYNFESEVITVDSEDSGTANYIGNNGDIYNGEDNR